ncbi:hypothetical protein DFJ74DRAFT_100934 [Hyaloraphidium curvatum]|nr:hypothetical protein DFJ74DRAFT_100934 [Hyaloraphidium curvatum]
MAASNASERTPLLAGGQSNSDSAVAVDVAPAGPVADAVDLSPADLAAKCRVLERIVAREVPATIGKLDRNSIDVPDRVVQEAFDTAGHAAVFLCLQAMENFISRSEHDLHFRDLRLSRAAYAESLAIELVHVWEDPEELFCRVLARKFVVDADFGKRAVPDSTLTRAARAKPLSALEKAVHYRALMFLSDAFVSECLRSIWYGRLYLQTPSSLVPLYKKVDSSKFGFEALGEERMKIPAYASAGEISMFLLFLGVFTWVVNHRTDAFTAIEIVMYIFSLSYGLNELRQLWTSGLADYFLDFYNMFDAAAVAFFAFSFTFRIFAMNAEGEERDNLNDWSFDLLAVNSIFLWSRTLSIFAQYEFFGIAILITRQMFKDAALFLLLFAVMLVGFSQSFIGLRPDIPYTSSVYLLTKAVMGSPEYGEAEEYSPYLGGALMVFWMTVSGLILLNVLIAIFNSSYAAIVESAGVEFLYTFAVAVCVNVWGSPDDYSFFPPANLVDILVVQPAKLLGIPGADALESFCWNLVTLPQALLVATYESFWSRGPPALWGKELVLRAGATPGAGETDEDLHLDGMEGDLLGLNTSAEPEKEDAVAKLGNEVAEVREQLARMEGLLRKLAGSGGSSASIVPSGV